MIMISSQPSPYKWEPFSHQFLPLVLEHQEELYALNFKKMQFDPLFFGHIKQWYRDGTQGLDCHSSLLFDLKDNLIGFYLFQKNQSTCYLMQMFVVQAFRGKGFGQLLLEHYEQAGKEKGATSSFLHASGINKKAISFYQRNHYIMMDEESDEEGCPRYLMFKNLLR